ncbi:MAG: amino acid permease [Desulfobacterales bacterium]|nr:amino acid permease [Desulfobacterales bacterium]
MTKDDRAEPGFLRRLGLMDTTFLVIGAVVGSGIYMTPGIIAAGLPSPGHLLAVWLAGGLITLCGALSFAELGAMFPQAGGQYIYLPRGLRRRGGLPLRLGLFRLHHVRRPGRPGRSFRRVPGFVPARALDEPRPVPDRPHRACPTASTAGQVVAAGSIVVLTALNSFGIRSGAVIQNVLTVFRLGHGGRLSRPGGPFGVKTGGSNFHPLFRPGPGFTAVLGPLGLALVAVFWTYDGWYAVNCTAGEVRDPEPDHPARPGPGGPLGHGDLHPREPGLSPGPAVRTAERRRPDRRDGRLDPVRHGLGVPVCGPGHGLDLRLPQRQPPLRAAGVLRHGPGRAFLPGHGPARPAEPRSDRGPLGSGGLVGGALPLGHLPIALRIHGLRAAAVLRGDGPGRLRPAVGGRPARSGPIGHGATPSCRPSSSLMCLAVLRRHRRQPAPQIPDRRRAFWPPASPST